MVLYTRSQVTRNLKTNGVSLTNDTEKYVSAEVVTKQLRKPYLAYHSMEHILTVESNLISNAKHTNTIGKQYHAYKEIVCSLALM